MMPTRLSGETVHRRGGRAARVGVVPPAGVEGLSGEVLDAGDARQLRLVQDAAGDHDEARGDLVAPVRGDAPPVGVLVPLRALDHGLEQRLVVEVEVATQQPAVLEDLGRGRVALGGHVARLLEQRKVGVGLDVAHAARIAVPVPRAAEVAALLDQPEVGDAELGQADRGEHPAEAAADDEDLGLLNHRLAFDPLGVGIAIELLVRSRELLVLAVAVRSQALVTLEAITLPQARDLVGGQLDHRWSSQASPPHRRQMRRATLLERVLGLDVNSCDQGLVGAGHQGHRCRAVSGEAAVRPAGRSGRRSTRAPDSERGHRPRP